jgi:uncharacterized protein with HEPN domain
MKDHRLYLIHIRDCLARIKSYTANGKDSFYQRDAQKTINKRPLLEIMETASEQAIANGMTPEILESILNDEDSINCH